MPTTSALRAETRSIFIAATPDAVLDLVADPRNLPRWAPDFARAVRPDAGDWLIDTGDGEARVTVRASREHGTLDLLAAAAPDRGAFTRVLPNGGGSEYLFTLLFADHVDEAAVARQMAIVEDELRAVRALCEGGPPSA
jgi:Polyketide cyclase / dehydrase and lipid transport